MNAIDAVLRVLIQAALIVLALALIGVSVTILEAIWR